MVHFPAQARKINEIHPTKISYTSGNGNPEKTYIFSKIYISGNGKPQKTFYISGNRSPEKTSYILGSKFPNLKNQKKLLWKNSLSSRKRNFLVPGFKKKTFYTSGGTFEAWKSNKKLFFRTTNLSLSRLLLSCKALNNASIIDI